MAEPVADAVADSNIEREPTVDEATITAKSSSEPQMTPAELAAADVAAIEAAARQQIDKEKTSSVTGAATEAASAAEGGGANTDEAAAHGTGTQVKALLKEGLMLADIADGMFFRQATSAAVSATHAAVNATTQLSNTLMHGVPGAVNSSHDTPDYPVYQDAAAIFDSIFQHKRFLNGAANHTIKTFEKRIMNADHHLSTSTQSTDEALRLVDPCTELINERLPLVEEHIERVKGVLRTAVDRERHWQDTRDAERPGRKERSQKRRTEVLEKLQQRQSDIDAWAAKEEKRLRELYSGDGSSVTVAAAAAQ